MSSKPTSVRSHRSSLREGEDPTERSPLLDLEPRAYSAPPSRPQTPIAPPVRPRRWHNIVALSALCGGLISVLAFRYFAPVVAAQYAQDAVVLDITSLSIDSFTEKGVKVRVQASVDVDAHRVSNWPTRTLGRAGSAMVKDVRVDDFDLRVHLPDYNDALLGTAKVPAMKIDVRNGHSTELDFVADAQPGPLSIIRLLADDYLAGSLHAIKVVGEVDLKIRKGLMSVSPSRILQEFVLKDIPKLPSFELTRLHIQEVDFDGKKAILANVSAVIGNPYPLEFVVPPLEFQVSLPGCEVGSHIAAAVASTSEISIKSKTDILVDAAGVVQSLPVNLTAVCPDTNLSPMDAFLGNYLHGQDAVVYVSGDGTSKDGRAPAWLVELLHSVTVPIPFPGHSFDNVIRSFGLSDVSIKLPGTGGDPDDVFPLLSATVEAMVALPSEMNLPLNITRLKALADVSFEKSTFGTLDIAEWIPAVSEPLPDEGLLRVRGEVKDAPLNVTNYSTFQKVVRKMLFGGGKINLGINGTADADITTSLGQFIVHEIPASGNITLDGLSDSIPMLSPKLNDIVIQDTTEQSMNFKIRVSVENPTPWEAFIPYANLLISNHGFVLGNGTVTDLHLTKGRNDIVVDAAWDPLGYSGKEGVKAGEKMMGRYISGHNTTLTLSTHKGSFPPLPELGKALSGVEITIPTPRLGGSDDPPVNFIEAATMHIFSSTADFLIRNPLPHNGIIIHVLDGAAMYNGSVLGTINYNNRFLINPGKNGRTMSPRLPVEWSLESVGYEAMRKALGGSLKIHAQADAALSIGNLRMSVFYNASEAVGAHVRL